MSAEVVVGLGPIGASVGTRLLNRGREVIGYEFDRDRAREWATMTGGCIASTPEEVDWSRIDTIHVAVRLAAQLKSVFDMLRARVDGAVTIIVFTTLAPSDAVHILSSVPERWRVFESPLSGGPQAALDGSMTLLLSGPAPDAEDQARFADISQKQFWTTTYGQPALLKLLNNTLGAYNALATAAILEMGSNQGVDPQQLLEIINVSSGQSWMSTNFDNFHYPLLFKDAGLLIDDLGPVPPISLGDQRANESEIEHARRLIFGD